MRERVRAEVWTATQWSLSVWIALFLLGTPSPSLAQVEPGAFTSLRVSVQSAPPRMSGILAAMNSKESEGDLAAIWVEAWASDSVAFDAFIDCLVGGNQAKRAARRFIQRRSRKLSKEESTRATAKLLSQLEALTAADRERLRQFARLARGRLAKKTEKR